MVFKCLQDKSFENIVGKGEIAQNDQFLLVWKSKICHLGKGLPLTTLQKS